MKKLILVTSITLALGLVNINASQASTKNTSVSNNDTAIKTIEKQNTKNDLIGFGSGALAGAAVGGPVGAMIGGVFGLFISNDMHKDEQLELSESNFAMSQQMLEEQQSNLIALQSQLKSMQEEQLVQLVNFEQQSNDTWLDDLRDFETNVQFSTASSTIDSIYRQQLNSLAEILSTYPQLSIQVAGFADERGDDNYNQKLSLQRANAVANYLVSQNVELGQISIIAKGEETRNNPAPSKALEGANWLNQKEDLAFARRVNISLVTPKEQMTAAN